MELKDTHRKVFPIGNWDDNTIALPEGGRQGAIPCRLAAPPSPSPKRDLIIPILREISEKGIEYTQTFRPELHNRYTPETLTTILRDLLIRSQKRYKFTVILVGEYSKTGMYHLHGSIQAPPQMINGLRRRIPREIGRAEFKAIKYVESWIKYCFKQEDSNDLKEIQTSEFIYLKNTP